MGGSVMAGTEEPGNAPSHPRQLLCFNIAFARRWRLVEKKHRKSTSCTCKGASFTVSGVVKEGVGQAEWLGSKKYYLCGGKLSGIWAAQRRVSRRHVPPSPVFHPHLVPLKPSGLPREVLGRDVTPLCSPCSTFLPEEGEGSSGKGTGRKGMSLSLPAEEVWCNKRINLGLRKWKLKTTSGLESVKSGTTLCVFCK